MDEFFKFVDKHPFGKKCPPPLTKEIKDSVLEGGGGPGEGMWGCAVRRLVPAKLLTAWCSLDDPLMSVGGAGYKAKTVREVSFELQKEAASGLRGNRKLTKAKVGEAFGAMNPNEDQTKILAQALYILKQIQTVCFNEETKTVWTVPEDLRAWSGGLRTVWVDGRCEKMLESGPSGGVGLWLSQREAEGWTVPWPVADGSLEEIKATMTERDYPAPKPAFGQTKLKKEDWAKALGRSEAVTHLAKFAV